MDELIRQIQEMSINDFEQQLHIHFSRLKKETDKLKIYIALLLLAKESLDTIKELNIEGLILHLKEKNMYFHLIKINLVGIQQMNF